MLRPNIIKTLLTTSAQRCSGNLQKNISCVQRTGIQALSTTQTYCQRLLYKPLYSSTKFSTSPAIAHTTEKEFSEIEELVSDKITSPDVGRLFAVIHLNGKQRKITTGDIVLADQDMEADIGEKIRLNKVLLVGSKDFTMVGKPLLSPNIVKVEATVIEKTLSHTRIIFWYIRRKGHRVFKLHKNPFVYLRINKIELSPPDSTHTMDITPQ